MRLLERDAVLAALTEYADEAGRGAGRVVLVSGEAGGGKTALLEALHERRSGGRWLWGACEGSFTPRPLGPVYDVARQVGGELARACDGGGERHQIFRALLDTLAAPDGLTVLCLEDVHWADEATLDLLGFLAPRLRRSPTLLLVTYRSDGLAPNHPLRMTLGELGTESACRRVDLPPLSPAAVTSLARERGVDPGELFRLTGGNPFFVTEVLDSGLHQVPPSARDAVLARAARLAADARRALDTAAVIGRRVDVDLLQRSAGVDTDALDGCLTAGVIVSEDGGYRFRHELARRAVEEALPAHRRTELNRTVLDALLGGGDEDAARLAHHAEAAGDAAAVLRFAPVAARQAAGLGAHRQAADHYARALRFAVVERDRAALLAAMGSEHALTDHWQDAAEAQTEALALWEQLGDRLRVGDMLRHLARTMWRMCRGQEALDRAEAAVRVLQELPASAELGWAYAMLAALSSAADRSTGDLLDRAEEIAERFGDRSLLASVLDSRGCAKPGLDGVPEIRRALEVAEAAGDQAETGRAYANLQALHANEYRLAEAEQLFRDGMDYCQDRDMGTYEHCLRGAHSGVLERLGRWDEADALLTFDLSERELSPVNKISKLVVKGVLEARRGRAGAGPTLDEALAYAEAGLEPAYILEASVARLEAAWLSGDVEAARREAQRALPHAHSHDDWYKGALGAWLRRCGLPEADLGRLPDPYVLARDGDWSAAAEAWRALGCPYEEALALLDSGTAEGMLQAVRVFERLGATATVARAQALMRSRGFTSIPRGARADTRANRFGLTRREQEVLALVCDGLTNADIGARLFIAEKTVDNHVSSVLAKMNVQSRRDASRLVRETEQPAPVI